MQDGRAIKLFVAQVDLPREGLANTRLVHAAEACSLNGWMPGFPRMTLCCASLRWDSTPDLASDAYKRAVPRTHRFVVLTRLRSNVHSMRASCQST